MDLKTRLIILRMTELAKKYPLFAESIDVKAIIYKKEEENNEKPN